MIVTDGDKGKDAAKDGLGRKKSVLSYFSLAQARFKKATEKSSATAKEKASKEKDKKTTITTKDKQKAADDLLLVAENAKSEEQKEREKEEQDLTAILDDLNLSAVNNRVFSFSKESEELFNKFKLVLKDIIAGAPTAYNDLEKLFTEYETTLKNMYGGLPPFLQNMVKSLPAKMTAALGPEVLAAASEKPGFDAKQKQTWQDGAKSYAKKKAKQKARIPSLKSLLSAEGAVATMLRSILNFLKLRFPAIMTGTNVVMSLAVCCKFHTLSTSLSLKIYILTNYPQYSSSSSGTATSAAARRASRKKKTTASPPRTPTTPTSRPPLPLWLRMWTPSSLLTPM